MSASVRVGRLFAFLIEMWLLYVSPRMYFTHTLTTGGPQSVEAGTRPASAKRSAPSPGSQGGHLYSFGLSLGETYSRTVQYSINHTA